MIPRAAARRSREQFGGDFTPEFMESLMTAANQQAAQYGPAGRGAIKTATGGVWTNVGPYRSNWIQNGVRVNESDTGRVRNFLVHPTNADIVYVLKSSGGLWKTTNFSHPRPNWRPMSDTVVSTSGGSVAFGKNPETLYLGSGDPFDPGVGGFIYKSDRRWRNLVRRHQARRSLRSSPTSRSTPAARRTWSWPARTPGLFRSLNGGATYSAVIGGGVHWSLQRTSAGWIVALTNGPERGVRARGDRRGRRGARLWRRAESRRRDA